MILKRKVDNYLKKWKENPNHLPLIISGARQIGKTTSIRKFGRENYNSFIEINFASEPKYKRIFENGYSTMEIIKQISYMNPNVKFIEGSTLIFFDEVQEFMDSTTSLKFFAEDGRFDVICSGSLLGINYKCVSSVSVGYKMDFEMKSLDFEEFLWARGYSDEFVNEILDYIISLKPIPEFLYDVLEGLFTDYIVVGGMPNVVKNFIVNQNFEGVLQMQKQLLTDYEHDISKYADGLDSARIKNVYRHIAPQLGKENKKFQITQIGHGARFRDYRGCNEWLYDAGIVNICYCIHNLTLPLKGNIESTNFKIYFADSSLLIASLDKQSQRDLRIDKNFGVYKGALYENLVAEALVKQGYELYFYKNSASTIEIDFLIRYYDYIVPIEVKAGRERAVSLNTVLSKYENMKFGIKFAHRNIGYTNNVITLPYFTVFLLEKFLEKVDLK